MFLIKDFFRILVFIAELTTKFHLRGEIQKLGNKN